MGVYFNERIEKWEMKFEDFFFLSQMRDRKSSVETGEKEFQGKT